MGYTKEIWKEHAPKRVKAKLEYDPTDQENKRVISIELIWYGRTYRCPTVKLFYKDPPGNDPRFIYYEVVDEKNETFFRIRFDVKDQFVNVVGACGPNFDS